MAGKLVSQLAQISSSAVYLKDVLLDMPVANRQQLQVLFFQTYTMGSKVKKLELQSRFTFEKHLCPVNRL